MLLLFSDVAQFVQNVSIDNGTLNFAAGNAIQFASVTLQYSAALVFSQPNNSATAIIDSLNAYAGEAAVYIKGTK
jgi:hypothetical protein